MGEESSETTPTAVVESTTSTGSATAISTPSIISSTAISSPATSSSHIVTSETGAATTPSISTPTNLRISHIELSSQSLSSTFSNPSGTVRPTNKNASQSGSKFGTRTLAGAIVGSFLGGCILAFLIAFLLLRRLKRTPTHAGKRESSVPPQHTTKGLSKSHVSVASKTHEGPSYMTSNPKSFDLSPYIPESADDTVVCMRIQIFFDQVSLHIDNYYSRRDSALRLSQEDIERINGYDSPFLGAPLASLLSSSRNQRGILTHILVYTLGQRIQSRNRTRSLLPAYYHPGRNSQANESLITHDDRAIFAWRMLTSHLQVQGQASLSANVGNDVIVQIADDFNQSFAPYGDPRFPRADRLAHLRTVVQEASGLAIWLFSQPCLFELHWSMASEMSKYITVLPSVVRIYDEQGRRLAVPQTLLEEMKAQI